jgi:hypothetical protein
MLVEWIRSERYLDTIKGTGAWEDKVRFQKKSFPWRLIVWKIAFTSIKRLAKLAGYAQRSVRIKSCQRMLWAESPFVRTGCCFA